MANLHHDLNLKCARKLAYDLALSKKNLEEEEKLKEARKSSLNSSVKRQLDDTLKLCKIQKKNKKLSESSSSADNNIEQLTDSDDINIFPESEDENDFLMNDLSTITTDSFVLVKFPTIKTIKYYIGRITHKISSEEFNITFLRRHGSNFVFPDVPEISAVPAHDIILHLMQPDKIGVKQKTYGFHFAQLMYFLKLSFSGRDLLFIQPLAGGYLWEDTRGRIPVGGYPREDTFGRIPADEPSHVSS
ncbi:hypothetical protein HHI36_004707 [Cryptolaemus montrouzieri]|uniref:Uncharacterized protein n=1 Tax=Cryptolaemus montrouzieri TaxID=559131 RepID=A0ABD2NS98_9CUCU